MTTETKEYVSDTQHINIITAVTKELRDKRKLTSAEQKSMLLALKENIRAALHRNNSKLVKTQKDFNKFKVLDPSAYEQELFKLAEKQTKYGTISDSLRKRVRELDDVIRELNSGRVSLGSKNYISRISQIYNLKTSLLNIYKNKDLFVSLVDEPITSLDELNSFISKYCVREHDKIVSNLEEAINNSITVFVNGIGDILGKGATANRFNLHPDLVTRLTQLSLTARSEINISTAIDTILSFKLAIGKSLTPEDFLQVEGITEPIYEAMTTVGAIKHILSKTMGKQEITPEFIKEVQNIINMSIEEQSKSVVVIYKMSVRGVYDMFGSDISDEDCIALNTILLISLFVLLDIDGAKLALSLMPRLILE